MAGGAVFYNDKAYILYHDRISTPTDNQQLLTTNTEIETETETEIKMEMEMETEIDIR